jgi:tripartite-type tricarboxylate transporter receptor subunit TctC
MIALSRSVLTLIIIALASSAAQAYPDRPINLIVPFPAGGATDAGARAMVPFLEKYLGAQFVVINRAGAGARSDRWNWRKRRPTATPSASSTRRMS